MELKMSDQQFQFDPFKFGGLVNQVEHLQQKVDVMEADIKKLVAMAERSKGSLWAIMGFSSVVGGFIAWLSSTFFHK
jgi:type II secretory pathway component PulM